MEFNFLKGTPAAEIAPDPEQQAIVDYFKTARTALDEGFAALLADPTKRMMRKLSIDGNLGAAIAVGETLALTGHNEGANQTLELLERAAAKFEEIGEKLTPTSREQLYVLRYIATLSNNGEDAAQLVAPVTSCPVHTIVEPSERKRRTRFMPNISGRVLNTRLLSHIAKTQDLAVLNETRDHVSFEVNDLESADPSSIAFAPFDSCVTAGLSADAAARDRLRVTHTALSETAVRLLADCKTFRNLEGRPLDKETAPAYRLFVQELATFEAGWMALRLELLSYLDEAALDKLYS
jgi:hypothetical protein